jgi:uncharacterized protein (DUF2235 family)
MAGPKSIVLFSDGTGNSSAQLFKTNVWRTYEAVDLGPATQGKRKQIAFYDDGIGTSAFRPLAMLAGMLGIGLKRNILDIYRFACRNYQAGDHIYGFGFSRGAFTIRLVIALIASQGLVQSTTEAELMARSADAYRTFRRKFEPRILKQPTRLLRNLRDWMIAWLRGRQRLEDKPNLHPTLRFVGVWDTVSAYGGPIVEIVRAIDNWFFALSMPDYRLNERVQYARHALALDDMRDAFQPLVWDELHERDLVGSGKVAADRMQQVWFTGMHADVGGGYPDESLSYVSLLWMLEEAEKAGLRTLTVMTDRFRALANSSGPIHDSRAGLGSYYRYQPRRLAGLLDPPSAECRINRDPALSTEPGKPRGLLNRIAIHESVAARIAWGTDRYAPITLPERFAIVPPQREGETAPQADNQSDGEPHAPPRPLSMITPATHATLLDPETARMREEAMARVWDLAWWRRITYFVALAITLLLVLLPLQPERTAVEGLCADDRCLLPGLFGTLGWFLPGIAEPWLVAFGRHPLLVLALVLALLVAYGISERIEAATRATAYAAWHGDPSPDGAHRLLALARRLRRSPSYQVFFSRLKWYAVPFLVAGLVLMVGVWLIGAFATQSWLVVAERDGTFCTRAANPASGTVDFRTDVPCTDLHRRVVANDQVEIVLRPAVPWTDAGYKAAPNVGVVDGLPFYAAPLSLYRRVVGADWMKPLVVVRGGGGFPAVGSGLRVERLDFALQPDGSFSATYQATTAGDLYLMVNDAVLPFLPHAFYRNNTGTATVEVKPVVKIPERSGFSVRPPSR